MPGIEIFPVGKVYQLYHGMSSRMFLNPIGSALHKPPTRMMMHGCNHHQWMINGVNNFSSDADRAAIPLSVCARHTWFLGEFVSRSAQWGSEALPNRRLHKQIESLDAWLAMPGFDA